MKKLTKVLTTTALVAGSLYPAAAFAATTNPISGTLTNTVSNVSNSLNNAANNLSGSLNNTVNQTAGSFNNAVNQTSSSFNNAVNNTATTMNNGSSLIPMDGTNHNFSTYNLTHTGLTDMVTPVDLIPVAYRSFASINQSVQDAVAYMNPIHLTYATNKLGTMGYGNVKIKVADAPANVQLWAKNTDGNWVNVADTGWGPIAGFKLDAQSNHTIDLYLMNSGSYSPLKLQLIDLKNPDKILAEDDLTYIMPK